MATNLKTSERLALEMRLDALEWVPEPNPIYKGWRIWKWTGWKGNKRILEESQVEPCPLCGGDVLHGDFVYMSQSMHLKPLRHFACMNSVDIIAGQWLAVWENPVGKHANRYVYASAPGGCGEYRKGDCFDISGSVLTGDTPARLLKAARLRSLQRLLDWIDQNSV